MNYAVIFSPPRVCIKSCLEVFQPLDLQMKYCTYSVKILLFQKLRFKSMGHFITGMKVSVGSTNLALF